jgi:hypothetical protein
MNLKEINTQKKNLVSFFVCGILFGFLFSGCINWSHVVEHNQLKTIEEKFFDRRQYVDVVEHDAKP